MHQEYSSRHSDRRQIQAEKYYSNTSSEQIIRGLLTVVLVLVLVVLVVLVLVVVVVIIIIIYFTDRNETT